MNIHAPERQEGESVEQYRERRAMSRRVARAYTHIDNSGKRSREALRDEQRRNGHGPKGAFGQGVINVQSKRRRDAMPKVGVLRDEHGAYTHVGRPPNLDGPGNVNGRRKWLAGISAQRRY